MLWIIRSEIMNSRWRQPWSWFLVGIHCLLLVEFPSLFVTAASSTNISSMGALPSDTDGNNETLLSEEDFDDDDKDIISIESELLLPFLPNYTLQALDNSSSPQSLALKWLQETIYFHNSTANGTSSGLTVLPEWRIEQLFSLACVYSSLMGKIYDYWLDDFVEECDWEHLECDPESSRVSSFDLKAVGAVEGPIPPEIELLSSLTSLKIWVNSRWKMELDQAIPPSITNLNNLHTLNFQQNELWGSIPTWLGQLTHLVHLSLGYNRLSQNIPSEIGLMTNLESLHLPSTYFTGTLPTELGLLTNLQALTLSPDTTESFDYPVLSGTLPSQLGLLTQLTWLDLANHHDISGTLPSELGNLSNLKYAYFSRTGVTGEIPPELCAMLQERSTPTLMMNPVDFRLYQTAVTCPPMDCPCQLEY